MTLTPAEMGHGAPGSCGCACCAPPSESEGEIEGAEEAVEPMAAAGEDLSTENREGTGCTAGS